MVAVAVAVICEKIRTGLGLITPKKGKKTGPDQTFKHYVQEREERARKEGKIKGREWEGT